MIFLLRFCMRFRLRFLRFLGPRWEENLAKIASDRFEKSIDFCTHLGIVFSCFFKCFSASLGTRKTSKNDVRGVIFVIFGICGSRSIPTCFWIIFGRIWGSKVDPKSLKNHAKMVFKKRLDLNTIFWWFCADLGGCFGRLEAPFSNKIAWKIVSKFWWFFTSLWVERRPGLEAPQGSFFYIRI